MNDSTNVIDQIDNAIARRLAGQQISSDGLDELDALEPLRAAPLPKAKDQARGRQVFLAQARHLLFSGRKEKRLFKLPPIKEIFVMKPFLRFALVLITVIGLSAASLSGAVLAAQASLPTDSLYGLKLASEETQLALANDPVVEITLLNGFSERRIHEMTQLAAENRSIPPELPARLAAHLDQALMVAAGLDAPQAFLEQIWQMTETQQSILAQAARGMSNEPAFEQAGQALSVAHALAQMGMSDPAQFRNQLSGQVTPTMMPSAMPSMMPSAMPSMMPSAMPTMMPSAMPSMMPSAMPSMMPSAMPTMMPSAMPTMMPSAMPTMMPSAMPTMMPSAMPTMPSGGGGGGMP